MTRATRRRTRTSLTDPLLVPTISVGPGRLGITLCPGKIDANSPTGQCWQRDLGADLDVLVDMGVHTLVSLVESWELDHLGVADLGSRLHHEAGIEWCHLPIVDRDTPSFVWEKKWLPVGQEIQELLRAGETVVVHCRGGLGRAGTVACRILIEAGWTQPDALAEVRRVRPGAVETSAQEAYVRCLPLAELS